MSSWGDLSFGGAPAGWTTRTDFMPVLSGLGGQDDSLPVHLSRATLDTGIHITPDRNPVHRSAAAQDVLLTLSYDPPTHQPPLIWDALPDGLTMTDNGDGAYTLHLPAGYFARTIPIGATPYYNNAIYGSVVLQMDILSESVHITNTETQPACPPPQLPLTRPLAIPMTYAGADALGSHKCVRVSQYAAREA